MKKAKKFLSMLLAILMIVSIIPVTSIEAEAVDTNAIKEKVVSTHKACLSKTGRTSFNGYCGLYVQTQLSVLGIGNYTAWNGKDWYGNIADGSKSNGYTVKKYSGYNALNTLINNHGSEIYNVVMCYPQQYGASASSPGYGHVMFIHAVVNGYVYFSESYSAANEPEGSAVVLSVSSFNSRYNSWYGNAQGCIWFSNTTVATTGINLNATQITMGIGDSKTVTATVLPSNASNKNVTWSSNNTNVATVTNGVIKAVGAGGATITAKTASGGYAKTVEVVVNESNIYPSNSIIYNGHYYEIYLQHLTWEQARDFCKEKGGHLVAITSAAENNAIKNLIAKAQSSTSDYDGYFIGLSDSETQNSYKWVTGEAYSYSNWATGQPSNSNWVTSYERYQDYGIIMNDGSWDDANNFANYRYNIGFICEYDEIGDAVVDELPEGADPNDYEIVTEYRSRDKQTTTSTASSMNGWTLYDSKTTYGSWGSVQSTSTKPTESDTLQITGTWTQYHYYHYLNYYSGCYNIDSIAYGTSYGKHTIDRNSALSKVSMADQGGKQAYGSQTCSCGFNFWFLSGTTTFYNYQTRSKTTTNYFYKWSDWSEWTEKPISATSAKEVETRTVYRLKDETTTYTVKYNANGGTGAPASQTKTHGATLTLSNTKPTRSGYTFLGWSASSTATSATYSAGGSFTANANTTLYAVWKANTYTVKYNANGGTGAPASQTKTHGVTLTLSNTKPTRSGYTFLGWSTSSTATSATYSAGGSFTANANTTLYAVWAKDGYDINNDGVVNSSDTGLSKIDGTWYYFKNGETDNSYTGLVKHTNGVWYYVEDGVLDWGYSGLWKHNGTWYYVQKGQINWKYNGLVKHTNGTWYYIQGAKLNWGYTGLVKHNTGSWFYVQKGQINFSKTGLVKHTNGTWYYVQSGKLNWNKTGLVKHTDGNWYYVQKGQINWNYTGLVKHTNGTWYYVQKGKLNWKYTGYAYYNGKKYKVVNGVKV